MTTKHSPAAADSSKDTEKESAVPPQATTAEASHPVDAVGNTDATQPSSAPAVPPGPDLSPELERMLLGFYADPAQYPELSNGGTDLPPGVSPMLAALSEWAHRLAGSGIDVQTLVGRPQEILKATAFFVQRALLAPRGSHYRVLGLNANASASEIHDHYRYLRRLFSVTDAEGSAHAAVMRVSEAYVVLRDPSRRRAYDSSVFGSGALPRLEAERRGAAGGRGTAVRVADTSRSARWARVGGVFVLVLALFWWFGGFEEPTTEAPTALTPEHEPTAPESVATTAPASSSAEQVTAEDQTAPETAPPAAGPSGTAAQPPAEQTASGGVTAPDDAATDNALLDRVEKFAGEDQTAAAPPIDSSSVAAPSAAPQETPEPAARPADTDAVQSAGAGKTQVPAPENTETSETVSDATNVTSKQEPLEPAPETNGSAGETAAGAETTSEPDVAVIPVVPEVKDAAPAAPKPDAEIEQLLTRADRQLADGQLTTPEGNSAVDTYREVLRLDPGNTRAAQGMTAIADRYAMLARYRLRRDELAEARTMVERGLDISPSHSPLLAAKADIEARATALTAPRAPGATLFSAGPSSRFGVASSSSDASPNGASSSGTMVSPPRPSSGSPAQPGPITSAPEQPAPIASRPFARAGSDAETETTAAATSSPSAGGSSSSPGIAPTAPAPRPFSVPPPSAAASGGDSGAASSTTATPPSSSSAATIEPPAAVATAPTPQSSQSDEPLSDSALDGLIDKFVQYYEGGDIDSFMTLFTADAETNSRKGTKGIRQDYVSLFAGSQSRVMRLKDLRWSRSNGEAVGEADFNLSLFGRRESRPSAYEGRLTFRVVEENGEPVIKGLFHRQRKLEDG